MPVNSTHTPLYQEAFPDFGALDVVLPEGFIDESWFKNTCPSFELPGPDNYASGWPLLTVFVDFADKSLRDEPAAKRFHVYIGPVMDDADLSSDDWAEVLQFIALKREQISSQGS